MSNRLGDKYEEFAIIISRIIAQVEDLRSMMHYVNSANEVDDEELPWYKLEDSLTSLGSALAATVAYMDCYKKESKKGVDDGERV